MLWIDFFVRELTFFAAFWLCIGALDDLAIDMLWLKHKWQQSRGHPLFKAKSTRVSASLPEAEPYPDHDCEHGAASPAVNFAIFVPVWQEADVIARTLRMMTRHWQGLPITIYVGCYPNDAATIKAVMHAVSDHRVRLVINSLSGPTTKAQCLNRLWRAMCEDEGASGIGFDAIILHDAEDIVHADAIATFATQLQHYDVVQLPVLPLPYPGAQMISGHYCDEFAESHGKAMLVRRQLGASLPLAGVGCAVSRSWLDLLTKGDTGPFSEQSLTEDYEMGVRLHAAGARSVFCHQRAENGSLIATRAYFPHNLGPAVRQKSRWTLGIALSGWDRLGWTGPDTKWRDKTAGWAEFWMLARDRRAMLAATVLLAAYIGLAGSLALAIISSLGWHDIAPYSREFVILLIINAVFLCWRLLVRCYFTWRYHGGFQAMLAIPRMLIANIIAIMAARRAVFAYCRLLIGNPVFWDKTQHVLPVAEEVALARDPENWRTHP